MHYWRMSMACSLLVAFAAGAAVVYKWTDADGVVHYSDQSMPGAERIVTSSGSANGNGIGDASRGPTTGTPTKAPAAALDYTRFAVASPAKEQVFFGEELVPVRLQLEPGLKTNQTITWHLNGKQLDDQGTDSLGFALKGLPRGTYAITATITDSVSGESQSADSVTFYVKQPSELEPLRKK